MTPPSAHELELALACTEKVKRGRVLRALVYDLVETMADAGKQS